MTIASPNLQRDNAELIACPFPHEAKRGAFLEIDTVDFGFVRGACSDCGCAGPYVSLANPELATKAEKAEAVKLWNTRSLSPQPPAETGDDGEVIARLWLWRNFVDGKPEYWAFDNPFPTFDGGDPQTLGQPCGWALYKRSTNGRPDVPDSQVEAIASRLSVSTGDDELVAEVENLRRILSVVRPYISDKAGAGIIGAIDEALSRKGRGE